MKKTSSSIVNLPSFVHQIYKFDELKVIAKIRVIFIGKITQFLINKFEGKLFCRLLNFLFKKKSNIHFDKNELMYKKILNNSNEIFYPNKRVTRLIQNNDSYFFDKLFETYCLEQVSFCDNDLIIDCGANIGELNYSFKFKNINIKYIGIEPDYETFNCLEKNRARPADVFHNIALSNKIGESKLYLDNIGGNSSLEFFGKNESLNVKTATLDSLNIKGTVRLLKLEAEGHEPEILEGAIDSLRNINYVSVDFGFERGIDQENTIEAVNNILTKNNFKLKNLSEYRLIGLYQNVNIE
jgi:FkbM family methyltransferase